MLSLRKYLFIGLMGVVVATSATIPAAHAQGAAAIIPFNFTVGSMQFQPGDYRLHTTGAQGSFLELSKIGGESKFTLLMPGVNDGSTREPYLVFHRYGKESFLTRVVFSNAEAYDLPRTSREKEILASQASGDQVEIPIGSAR